MERCKTTPRSDWQTKVESLGFIFHTPGGNPYWDESTYYKLSTHDVEVLEKATAELYQLYLEAGDYILRKNLFHRLQIPPSVVPLIREAWENEPFCLNYGRFDLGYDGKSPPKLYEFNCDTPTCLLEAAVIQWQWKEELFPSLDQFNSLHEKLVAKWKDIGSLSHDVHFMHVADPVAEDMMTVSYMRDVAEAAGQHTVPLFAEQVGWDKLYKKFVDMDNNQIHMMFHLYPWEWMVREEFGSHIKDSGVTWVEPIWKMMWSNKAVLPVLHMMFPDHPNLLPSYTLPVGKTYIKKPILGREGRNVQIVEDDVVTFKSDGEYGEEGFAYQELHKPELFDGMQPVIGSWVVDGEPAGIGIREAIAPGVTDNGSLFVPHVIGT